MPDRKLSVGKGLAYKPKVAIDAFLKGVEYPFDLRIKNVTKRGLLLPDAKSAGVIDGGSEVTIVIRDYSEVWRLVSDAAGIGDIKGLDEVVILTVAVKAAKAGEEE